MRRGELIANLFLPIIIVISIIMTYVLFQLETAPHQYKLTILFVLFIGFVLFLKAKLSVFKKGILISFGSAKMTRLHRFLYVAGYFMMGFGAFLALILYAKYS